MLMAEPPDLSDTPIAENDGTVGQDLGELVANLRLWAKQLGFSHCGISGIELGADEHRLLEWLEAGYHGGMDYMARHGKRRSRPAALVEGTCSVISVRLPYWPTGAADAIDTLTTPDKAYVSRYALGRDYHKLMRSRLARLARRIESAIGPFRYRAFSDSAPVMEKPLARNAGLGWIGKHTNLIDTRSGSYFFLGELFTDLPLADAVASEDKPAQRSHCGSCQACMDACPTGAIVAPYQLDARLCISYLTIEHFGAIPLALRGLIGNRIYGCDDCQLYCPWNKFDSGTRETDFHPRESLDNVSLIDLFAWSEADFLRKLEGSAIRRIGHARWLRNIAVALGNAARGAADPAAIIKALETRRDHPSELVREHVEWALEQASQT